MSAISMRIRRSRSRTATRCNTASPHDLCGSSRLAVNSLDLVILLAALIAGVGGWRFGFFARVLTWCGVAVGLLVGIPYVPRVVTAFGGTSVDSRVTVAVLFLVLVATLGHALGLGISAIGHRLALAKPLARWDRLAGAAIGAVGVVAFVWIMIPSLTLAEGWPALWPTRPPSSVSSTTSRPSSRTILCRGRRDLGSSLSRRAGVVRRTT